MKENSREEDIKIVEKLINTMKSDRTMFEEDKSKETYTFFINSLEHILSDYKRVLKENDKLKKSNQCYINSIQAITPVLTQDYVSKQEIKDKIKKLNKKEKEELKRMKGQDRYFVKQIYQNKRIILKELIEEREKKWKK